jgi:hypothetical protein
MFVVDTNILIYAADSRAREQANCRALLEQWRSRPEAWYLTWGIVYEFLRVTTHPRVFRHPWNLGQAWSFIEALLAAPGLLLLVESDRHRQVAAEVYAQYTGLAGNLLFDARTAILMKEHGVRRIYTRDMDFHRFPFLEVIDPFMENA